MTPLPIYHCSTCKFIWQEKVKMNISLKPFLQTRKSKKNIVLQIQTDSWDKVTKELLIKSDYLWGGFLTYLLISNNFKIKKLKRNFELLKEIRRK